jgi:hypothetical protein
VCYAAHDAVIARMQELSPQCPATARAFSIFDDGFRKVVAAIRRKLEGKREIAQTSRDVTVFAQKSGRKLMT